MFKETYNVIGVMSGTSLDGIDLARINFSIENEKWSYEILESETVSYSNDWLNKLKVAVGFSSEELLNTSDLMRTNKKISNKNIPLNQKNLIQKKSKIQLQKSKPFKKQQ